MIIGLESWTLARPELFLAAVTALLSLPDRPSAVVCTSDIMACGAMDAAADLGLDVPRDLAVTGFDDMEIASLLSPGLTTVPMFAVRERTTPAAGAFTGMRSSS